MRDPTTHIDDLFREELGGYTETPPAAVWEALEKRLDGDKKRRAFPFMWLWYISGLFCVILVAATLIWRTGGHTDIAKAPLADQAAIVATENPSNENNDQNTTTAPAPETGSNGSAMANENTNQITTPTDNNAQKSNSDNTVQNTNNNSSVAALNTTKTNTETGAPNTETNLPDKKESNILAHQSNTQTNTPIASYAVNNGSAKHNIVVAEAAQTQISGNGQPSYIVNGDDEENETFGSDNSHHASQQVPVEYHPVATNINYYGNGAKHNIKTNHLPRQGHSALAAAKKHSAANKVAPQNSIASKPKENVTAPMSSKSGTTTQVVSASSPKQIEHPTSSIKNPATALTKQPIVASTKHIKASTAASRTNTNDVAKTEAAKPSLAAAIPGDKHKPAHKNHINTATTQGGAQQTTLAPAASVTGTVASKQPHKTSAATVTKTAATAPKQVGKVATTVVSTKETPSDKNDAPVAASTKATTSQKAPVPHPTLAAIAPKTNTNFKHRNEPKTLATTATASTTTVAGATKAKDHKKLNLNEAITESGTKATYIASTKKKVVTAPKEKTISIAVQNPTPTATTTKHLKTKATPKIAAEDAHTVAVIKPNHAKKQGTPTAHSALSASAPTVNTRTKRTKKGNNTTGGNTLAMGGNRQAKNLTPQKPVVPNAYVDNLDAEAAQLPTPIIPKAVPAATAPKADSAAPTAKADDAAAAEKASWTMKLSAGIKGGYESGYNNNAAHKLVISPYVEYALSTKLKVLFQPGIKYAGLASHNINGNQSFYNVTKDQTIFKDSVAVFIANIPATYWVRNYTYRESYDSIVKSYAAGGKYMEFETPILLKYQINKKWSVYGGVNLVYSKLVGIHENTFRASFTRVDSTHPTFAPQGAAAPSPLPANAIFTYNSNPLSSYSGPLYPTPKGSMLRMGYMLGFSYELRKRWTLDGLVQQGAAKASYQGGYNINNTLSAMYFRFSLGYKLTK